MHLCICSYNITHSYLFEHKIRINCEKILILIPYIFKVKYSFNVDVF